MLRFSISFLVLIGCGYGYGAQTVRAFETPAVEVSARESLRPQSHYARLRLDTEVGDIDIEAKDVPRIEVRLTKTASAGTARAAEALLKAIRVETVRAGDTYVVRIRRPERSRAFVDISASVPARTAVSVLHHVGDIEISGIQRDVEVKTGIGDIRLGAVDGNVILKTGTGDIEVEGHRGALTAHTGQGDLEIKASQAVRMEVNTGVGDIQVTFIQLEGSLTATAGVGSIDVALPTLGDKSLHASTGVGSFHSDFPVDQQESFVGATARRAGQSGHIDLKTGSGSISIRRIPL